MTTNDQKLRGRLWAFRLIAVSLPFAGLLLLEGLLQLFGYGHDLSLFVADPQHPGFWVMNRHVSERYFTEAANATIGNYEPFRQKKAPGTVRIFVLGESTTIGYPYFHNGSFHRWLHYRLMRTFPNTRFEIINLALTAVNSYTVYDLGRELADYQPNAVLIYAGHNEYYGALGVGSTSFVAPNTSLVRWAIRMRQFRLVQLVTNAVTFVKNALTRTPVDTRENLMKRMAANQQIAYGSGDYLRGIDQLTENLTDLCEQFSGQQIPVFISDLVSNEKDLPPFISAAGNGPASAQTQFRLARQAYNQGAFGRAKTGFVRAKELDMLRFRAPEAMNQRIRALADRFPNVTLVDTRRVFEQHSPHGTLGREILLEHVHPNLYGYALLSDAFYKVLVSKSIWSEKPKGELTLAELRQQMPITLVDSLAGAYEVSILKEGWPFNEPMPAPEQRPRTTEEQLAGALTVKQLSWPDAMNRLRLYYTEQKNRPAALTVAQALVLEYPFDARYYEQAGKLSLAMRRNDLGIDYLKQAFHIDAKVSTAQPLFIALLKADQPAEALPLLRFAATNSGSPSSLTQLIPLVEQLVTLKKQYAQDSSSVLLSNQIAAGYLSFANATAARNYVDNSLRRDPGSAAAQRMRAQIQAIETKTALPN